MKFSYKGIIGHFSRNKFAYLIIFAVLSIFLVVTSFYYNQFHKNGLSKTVADWGVFGDYLGGTLGAIFGSLSFIGVLYTLYQNKLEIEEARKATVDSKLTKNRDEIYRIIETIYNDLNRNINLVKFDSIIGKNKDCLSDILNSSDGAKYFVKYNLLGLYSENIKRLNGISKLITALKNYCELYESHGGSKNITYYFVQHFWSLSMLLITLKTIDVDTFEYFERSISGDD